MKAHSITKIKPLFSHYKSTKKFDLKHTENNIATSQDDL